MNDRGLSQRHLPLLRRRDQQVLKEEKIDQTVEALDEARMSLPREENRQHHRRSQDKFK